MPNPPITEEDSGRELSVRLGDEVRVRLKENPTTGYLWNVESMTSDILELEASSFEPAEGDGFGAGGARVFVFCAKAPGRTTIGLGLQRRWERNVSPTARFHLVVHIR